MLFRAGDVDRLCGSLRFVVRRLAVMKLPRRRAVGDCRGGIALLEWNGVSGRNRMFRIWSSRRPITGPGLLLLLLVCAGFYLWSHRPLSEAERKIVGTWALNSDSGTRLRFDADRRMSLKMSPGTKESGPEAADDPEFVHVGVWYASERSLQVTLPGIRRRTLWSPYWTSSGRNAHPNVVKGGWRSHRNLRILQWVGPDHLTLDHQLYFRVQDDLEPPASHAGEPAVANSRS